MARWAVTLLSASASAAIVWYLFVPDCYDTDAGPGAGGGGCFTRIGLETRVGPGLFFLAAFLSVITFVLVAIIAARAWRSPGGDGLEDLND